MPQLTDRAEIRTILETDRPWSAFALADLEPGYFEHSKWFYPADGSAAVALLYSGFEIPVLLTVGPAHLLAPVLEEIDAELNQLTRLYAAVRSDVFALLCRRYRIGQEKEMQRMVLDPALFQPVLTPGVERLGPGDVGPVRELYADGGTTAESPEFFVPSMLDNGVYYGIHEGSRLVAVAGTHVVAPGVGVAGLGNIYTRRDRRQCGFGTTVTRATTDHLLRMGIQTIALNVRADNHTAISVYEHLGFRSYCRYYEGIVLRI